MYIVNCDCSIEPINPGGILAWAFIVKRPGKGIVYQAASISERGGELATNNVGEYQAVIAAMLWLIGLSPADQEPVILQSDSQLIVNQVNGQWQCHDPKLLPLRNMVLEARDRYTKSITFKWIPRTKNTEVDDLSRTVYDQNELAKMREVLCSPKAIFGDDDIPF